MHPFPHTYTVTATGNPDRHLESRAEGLPTLAVAPPVQFGGPGDVWTPEDLLMAAIANCLVLSFRAIAKAGGLEWQSIECSAAGILDKVDRKVVFTGVTTRVKLVIGATQSRENAERMLHKADETCFVSNSLACDTRFECDVVVAGE